MSSAPGDSGRNSAPDPTYYCFDAGMRVDARPAEHPDPARMPDSFRHRFLDIGTVLMIRTFIIGASLFFLSTGPTLAQELPAPAAPAGEQLVDRVVAVVGDTTLLLSDVYAELDAMQAQGFQMPTTERELEQVARQIVASRVDDMLVMVAAREAGVEIDEPQVRQMVERDLDEVRQRFGSEVALERALAESGLTMEEYRETLTERYRGQLLQREFVGGRLQQARRPRVTEEEMQAFFRENREAFGELPARISFRQAVIQPQISEEARAEARERAAEILERIQGGEEFEDLARRFSDDTGSAERGGDLGWFRRGAMVRPFEEVVFNLRPGQVSGLVDTDFGVHIIKLERSRGAERHARHILIRAERTDADRERARETAESVAEATRGGASLLELARQHGTPNERRSVEDQPLDRLPSEYRNAFENASEGDVVGPFETDEGALGPSFVVARITERVEPGQATLDDVRDQVRNALEEQKMVENLVEELRRTTHVQVYL